MCPGNTATSLMESSRSPFPPKKLRTLALIHRSFDVIELVHGLCLARFELRGVPDLDIVEDTRHNHFFIEVRVIAEKTGDHDSPLTVDRAGHRSGRVESPKPFGFRIELGRFAQLLFELGPLGGGVQSEVIFLDDQHWWTFPPAYELAAEDTRYAESSLGVDGVIMSPAKHRSISASFSNRFRMLMNALKSGSLEFSCPGPNSEVPRRPT